MKRSKMWELLWKKLALVPYGKAVIVKVDGEWTDTSVTRVVRVTKEGLAPPLTAVRTVMDTDASLIIQEAFDSILSGTLTLDKHEGRIMSYTITELLSCGKVPQES